MRPELSQIKNIVVVMMENRSFDHLLGYLSLNQFGNQDVDGLRDDPAWNQKVASSYNGTLFLPWHSTDPFNPIAGDPPHERAPISLQLRETGGVFQMDGFVTN